MCVLRHRELILKLTKTARSELLQSESNNIASIDA
jgi:hypothetical protein